MTVLCIIMMREVIRMEELVTTVNSYMEAEIVLSLLRSEGISAVRKVRGFGEYANILFGGDTVCQIDIFVSKEELERAKLLLESSEFVDFPEE